jgi:hypothetical protein
VAALAAATAALTGACAQKPTGFDSEAYCQAIAEPGVELDSKAMIEGDEQALADAKGVYERLKELGPAELADEWQRVLTDLDSMIAVASGTASADDVDRQPFTDAFAAIEMDKHERCGL